MINASRFYELVSGRRRGPSAALARAALRCAEVPYTWAVRWRNGRFDRGRRPAVRVEVPVVSVGNLTLGGTGKTPMVEYLARHFRRAGVRVTIVSRGYGAQAGSRNDEALELEQKLPDVPHLQNPDRVGAAGTAIEELAAQLILLDDGFQHRALARDFDLVMLDAAEPFGYGHVFPRGTLREPVEGLARADAVVLARADMVDAKRREEIRNVVRRHAPQAVWMEVVHAPTMLLRSGGHEAPLASLAGRPVAAFCGIGNPAGFRHTLEVCGYQVVAWRELPDHHDYTRTDVDELATWAERSAAEAVVCTHKDLVKLRVARLEGKPLWAVRIGMQPLDGEEELADALVPLAQRALKRDEMPE